MTTQAHAPLVIRSSQGDYGVEFAADLAAATQTLSTEKEAVIVVDRKVAALHAAALGPWLQSRPHLLVDATEEFKSLDGVAKVATFLQESGCSKSSTLIAVGGGIVQDVAAFCAHAYHRGMRWAFLPTTLLAMADSCIGAKCGINLNAFKNQLGFFYSPARIVICADFVRTLEPRDVASGHGEILKLAVTGSQAQLDELETVVARDGLLTPELGRLIRQSLVVKQGIIEIDEHEKDLRRILNYGHTFGHALETTTNNAVPHGLAVAWGMDLVNELAVRRGVLAKPLADRLHDYIGRYLKPKVDQKPTAEGLIAAARRDKKAAQGSVNLIFLETPGKLKIVKSGFDDQLTSDLTAYLRDRDVSAGLT